MYSGVRTTLDNEIAVGTSQARNIDAIEAYAPTLAGLKTRQRVSTNTLATFELCKDDPCETQPFRLIYDTENIGSGKSGTTLSQHLNNQISRIRTPAGYYIEIFEGGGYTGKRLVFGHPTASKSFSMKQFGVDDNISSFIVRPFPTEKNGVKLCKKINCRGGSVTRTVGSVPSMPRRVGAANLSRIILSPGWKIEIFDGPNFRGASKVFFNAHSSVELSIKLRNENADWNDRTKSFIVSTLDS